MNRKAIAGNSAWSVGIMFSVAFALSWAARVQASSWPSDALRGDPHSLPAPQERETPPAPPAPPYLDDVLPLAPAEAAVILYTHDLGDLLDHPLVAALAPKTATRGALRQQFSKVVEGPMMLAFGGAPLNPLTWRITAGGGTPLDGPALLTTLRDEIVPAVNASPAGGRFGGMTFFDDGATGTLTLPPIPLPLTVAARDGRLFIAANPAEVADRLGGAPLSASFMSSDEFKRLFPASAALPQPTRLNALTYVHTAVLTPMAASLMHEEIPGLFEVPDLFNALQLTKVESVALAAYENRLRLSVGVSSIERGPWRFIASPPARLSLAGLFPPETTLLAAGSMESGADAADDLAIFAGAIDGAMVDEYRAECAEWAAELGFDPHRDLLANFVQQWAAGATLGEDGFWHDFLFAVKVADPDKFQAHLETLRAAFKLETDVTLRRGIRIETARRQDGAFAFARANDCVFVAAEPQTIANVIDSFVTGRSLANVASFQAAGRLLDEELSRLVFINVSQMARSALAEGPIAENEPGVEDMRSLAESSTAAALGVKAHDKAIVADLVLASSLGDKAADTLWSVAVRSLSESTAAARRQSSMARMKGILTSCLIYTNDHKGQWPASLATLVEEGALRTEDLATPYGGDDEDATAIIYLYRDPGPMRQIVNPAQAAVLAESRIHNGGAVFGFADGHVEWIESPRAEALLEHVRGGS